MISGKRLNNSIWFRQTRNTIIVALVVGFLISLMTILLDLKAEKEGALENAQQIISILQRPATQAAFNIDSNLAETVIDSLMEYKIIYQARIIDDLGDDLAFSARARTSGLFGTLSEALFGDSITITRELVHQESRSRVGKLSISLDTHLLAQQFFQRSALVMVSGVIRNILLAAILLFLFHKTLSKPLLALISQVAALDPLNPKPSLTVTESHKTTELGQLSDQLNRLLSVLNDSQVTQKKTESDLRAHKQNLEKIVNQRTLELQKANCELEKLATIDPLTRIWNLRGFNEQATIELERSKRQARDVGVLLMDIDHFKLVNDTYGHAVGDEVLKYFCSSVGSYIREGDIFARIGGEEFAVLLHAANQDEAMVMAERIRRSVEAMRVPLEGLDHQNKIPDITVSIGLTSAGPQQLYDLKQLMLQADKALYQAKDEGRNRLVAADQKSTSGNA